MKENLLKGFLVAKKTIGYRVKHEFGQNQTKYYIIHNDSRQQVRERGKDGQELTFVLRGNKAPNTLNGVVVSALIIEMKE